ncbi:hypothetical protein ACFWYW_59075 [Nonomuraea sp. NPDC059023]|uniref:hypothetical protein n=1 Tax=unclassified Nonomuraea TaxID=2593643 RepID=UPI003676D14B
MPFSADASCKDLLAYVEASPDWSPAFPHTVGGLSDWQHATATMSKFQETRPLEVSIPTDAFADGALREMYRQRAVDVLNRAEKG